MRTIFKNDRLYPAAGLIMICFFLTPGCRLTKEKSAAKLNLKEQRQTERNAVFREERKELSSLSFLNVDSSDEKVYVKIYPQGAFEFSPEKGFVGTAGALEIRSNQKAAKRELIRIEQETGGAVEMRDKETENVNKREKEKVAEVRKETDGAGSVWWVFLLGTLCGGIGAFAWRGKIWKDNWKS